MVAVNTRRRRRLDIINPPQPWEVEYGAPQLNWPPTAAPQYASRSIAPPRPEEVLSQRDLAAYNIPEPEIARMQAETGRLTAQTAARAPDLAAMAAPTAPPAFEQPQQGVAQPSDPLSMSKEDVQNYIIAGGTIPELEKMRLEQAYGQIPPSTGGLAFTDDPWSKEDMEARLVSGVKSKLASGRYSPEEAANIAERHGMGDYETNLQRFIEELPAEVQAKQAKDILEKTTSLTEIEAMKDPGYARRKQTMEQIERLSSIRKGLPEDSEAAYAMDSHIAKAVGQLGAPSPTGAGRERAAPEVGRGDMARMGRIAEQSGLGEGLNETLGEITGDWFGPGLVTKTSKEARMGEVNSIISAIRLAMSQLTPEDIPLLLNYLNTMPNWKAFVNKVKSWKAHKGMEESAAFLDSLLGQG